MQSWPSSRFVLDRQVQGLTVARRGPANSLRWPRWCRYAGEREFGSQSSHTGLARSSKAVSVNGVKIAGDATSRETQIERAAVAPTMPTLAAFPLRISSRTHILVAADRARARLATTADGC